MTKNHLIALFIASAFFILGSVYIIINDHNSIVGGAVEYHREYVDRGINDIQILNDTVTDQTNSDPQVKSGRAEYSLSDIKLHSNKTSCWTAINGSVYDLTTWIPQHPGGAQAILSLCGQDGTQAFTQQHGLSKGVQRTLAMFKIGDLN